MIFMSETKDSNPARIIITTATGNNAIEQMLKLAAGVEVELVAENGEIKPAHTIEYRCETLGIPLDTAIFHASCMGVSVDEYLNVVEGFIKAMPTMPSIDPSAFDELSELYERPYKPDPDNTPHLTDSQIRKQLKYEKNPMRIKQLNKMLSRKKRRK